MPDPIRPDLPAQGSGLDFSDAGRGDRVQRAVDAYQHEKQVQHQIEIAVPVIATLCLIGGLAVRRWHRFRQMRKRAERRISPIDVG